MAPRLRPVTVANRLPPPRSKTARNALTPFAAAFGDIAFDVLRAEMLAQRPRQTAQDYAPHVPAAIAALGRIKPEYAGWLTQFMVEAQPDGIDLAVLKLQRRKPQLNRTEKRRIGLRSETPFSRQAFDMLTEAGRAAPLEALRATAMQVAARQEAGATERRQREIGITHYVWIADGDAQLCPACTRNNGRTFAWDAPPPGGHPGMRSCCGDGHCRCVAQAVLSDSQDLQADDDAHEDQRSATRGPRRLGVTGIVLLAFLGLACLSLLRLLPGLR